MADNYLERRMEDLKAGRLGAGQPTGVRKKKAGPEFPWQALRVAIAGNTGAVTEEIARGYLKSGCKVALLDGDKSAGDRLAYEAGIRFHRVDLRDSDALATSFDQLLKAWRGVEVIVMSGADDTAEKTLARLLREHRQRYAIPSDYTDRIIRTDAQASAGADFIARACVFLSVEGNQNALISYRDQDGQQHTAAESHEID